MGMRGDGTGRRRPRELDDIADEIAGLVEAVGEAMADFDPALVAATVAELHGEADGWILDAEDVQDALEGRATQGAACDDAAGALPAPPGPADPGGRGSPTSRAALLRAEVARARGHLEDLADHMDARLGHEPADRLVDAVIGAVEEAVHRWEEACAQDPLVAASLRGQCPPRFLAERERVESIARRVFARGPEGYRGVG